MYVHDNFQWCALWEVKPMGAEHSQNARQVWVCPHLRTLILGMPHLRVLSFSSWPILAVWKFFKSKNAINDKISFIVINAKFG